MRPSFVLALVLGVILVLGRKLLDEDDVTETAFVKLEKNGGSDVDVKKSSGDHIAVTISLINGPVTFTMDKFCGKTGQLTIVANSVEFTAPGRSRSSF